MDTHLNPIAEGQFKEAQKFFTTLTFTFPNIYSVTLYKKTYKIQINANYPRDTPSVYEDGEVLSLSLPILDQWKPFFQLVHILNELKIYASLAPYPLINMTDIATKINNPELGITNAADCYTKIDVLKTARKNEESSKRIKKAKDFNVIDGLTKATNLYNTTKERFEAIKELKSKTFFSERNCYENEIVKLNDEIVKTQDELKPLVNLMREIENAKGTIDKSTIDKLIEIKGREFALRKKRSILQEFVEKKEFA